MKQFATRLVVLVVGMATMLMLSVGLASTAQAKPRTAEPSTVTLTDAAGAVDGTFDVSRFRVTDGQLMAVGTFTGSVTDALGVVTEGTQQLALPVDAAASTGTCEILDLVLGPLTLDLLGLVVTLNQVELNITAQSGPGNLLGNLLCAVAGLLDGPTGLSAILTQIGNLLNQLLGALR